LNQGYVLGALYRAAAPAPADRVEVSTTVWKDGAFERYDRDGHHYRLEGRLVAQPRSPSATANW
jgi:phage baseplate assembly protein gpV